MENPFSLLDDSGRDIADGLAVSCILKRIRSSADIGVQSGLKSGFKSGESTYVSTSWVGAENSCGVHCINRVRVLNFPLFSPFSREDDILGVLQVIIGLNDELGQTRDEHGLKYCQFGLNGLELDSPHSLFHNHNDEGIIEFFEDVCLAVSLAVSEIYQKQATYTHELETRDKIAILISQRDQCNALGDHAIKDTQNLSKLIYSIGSLLASSVGGDLGEFNRVGRLTKKFIMFNSNPTLNPNAIVDKSHANLVPDLDQREREREEEKGLKTYLSTGLTSILENVQYLHSMKHDVTEGMILQYKASLDKTRDLQRALEV
jgi:hypothetical protein